MDYEENFLLKFLILMTYLFRDTLFVSLANNYMCTISSIIGIATVEPLTNKRTPLAGLRTNVLSIYVTGPAKIGHVS